MKNINQISKDRNNKYKGNFKLGSKSSVKRDFANSTTKTKFIIKNNLPDNSNENSISNKQKIQYDLNGRRIRTGLFSPLSSPSSPLSTKLKHIRNKFKTKKTSEFEIRRVQKDVFTGKKKNAEKQYIYIIPDGIDILEDRYKIFKQDIRCYIGNMLPDKEEIEK